jgi:hypothetical protein
MVPSSWFMVHGWEGTKKFKFFVLRTDIFGAFRPVIGVGLISGLVSRMSCNHELGTENHEPGTLPP